MAVVLDPISSKMNAKMSSSKDHRVLLASGHRSVTVVLQVRHRSMPAVCLGFCSRQRSVLCERENGSCFPMSNSRCVVSLSRC